MLCRVCLEDSKQTLNIFSDSGIKNRIAETLQKHLWFTLLPNDELTKVICKICWRNISEFNKFYIKVEEAHKLLCLQANKNNENNQLNSESKTTETDSTDANITDKLEEDEVNVSVDNIIETALDIKEEIFEQKIRNETVDVDEELDLNDDASIDEPDPIGFEDIKEKDSEPQENIRSKAKNTKISTPTTVKREQRCWSTPKDNEIVRKHIQLICPICNLKVELYPAMVKHFRSYHKDVKPFVNCCGRRFKKNERLVQHAWLHEDPNYFQCSTCQQTFRDHYIMASHIKAQHPTEEELLYDCDQCEKRFARRYLLKLHKAIHVPVEERSFFCYKCPTPRAFASQNLLNIHTSSLHNRATNVCDFCGKTIRDLQAFKKHVLTHQGVSRPRVKCPDCDTWLKDEDNLKQHFRRLHKSNNLLKCNQCEKICKNQNSLTNHMRVVHPTTLFNCEICSKVFKRAITLKEHMAQHTGEYLYECPFCNHKFNSNANMHSHKKKMHPVEWETCKRLKQRP